MDERQIGEVTLTRGVRATMRDGCELAADVYRPANAGRALPVMLLRLPYDRRVSTETNYALPTWYARQGFIVVIQDTRGRYASGGEFVPFVHEAADGYDTVEWAARLEGSNGKVGMYGASYSGYLQLLTAAAQPPSLGAICPAIAGSDLYDGWLYEGGALSLSFSAWWAASLGLDVARRRDDAALEDRLAGAIGDAWRWYGSARPYDLAPIAQEIPFFREWLDHPTRDDYWTQRSAAALYERITVPALHIGGWYDSFNEGTVRNFVRLTQMHGEESGQHMLIGPWAHVPWGTIVGGTDFGPAAEGTIVDRAQVRFLRRCLDPDHAGDERDPAVYYFVLFENEWHSAVTWPPAGAEAQSWYLRGDGGANSAGGDGRLELEPPGEEPPDVYAYNPADPVPSLGGHSCCLELNAPMGAFDQARVEQRRDVLVYTSAPLTQDLRLAGPSRLQLWVQTDAPDADYTGKLCVVDGRASINIAEGIHRASGELAAATPGEPLALEIELRNVAALVRAGQRLRLEVTSGSFPMYDVNPQSGVPAAHATVRDYLPATHAVFHTAAMPSRLIITATEASTAAWP